MRNTEVAAKLRVSESTLALIAIRTLLDSDVPDLPPRTSSSNPAVDRITIRLRPGDRLAIRNRAAERRMKDSAYRLLARTAREAAQAGVLPRDHQQDLSRTRALVSDVERRMHEFAQAALVTWESRVD